MREFRIVRAVVLSAAVAAFFSSCAQVPKVIPITWNSATAENEAEYGAYTSKGAASVIGQAFLSQRGGGVVKAAGQTITLDPATTIGNEWWGKAGKVWAHKDEVPPVAQFLRARRTAIADAEGRFKFSNVPPGRYYLRT